MGLFLAVVLGIVALAHFYVWLRLVRRPSWPARTRRAATTVLVLLAILVPIGFTAQAWTGPGTARVLVLVGATWGGIVFLFVATLAVLDLLRGGAWLARRRRPATVDIERRRFLARAIAGVAGTGTAVLSAVAIAEATASPDVVNVRVPIPDLPPAFEGFRIVQWSDVHAGPLLRRDFIERLVERTNALAPDVLAITGDLVDGDVSSLSDVLAPLSRLRTRHGTYFTTGNHEFYSGVEPWIAHLPTLGVRVLQNERVAIERDGAHVDLAGIHDAGAVRWSGYRPDADRALLGRDPSRPVVLLAHQPKQVFDAQRLGVDLVLSGHTHGGQIFPFGLVVRLTQPAIAGLHRFGRTWLYVSRGTGFWGPPMRLACPAEITVLELVREPA